VREHIFLFGVLGLLLMAAIILMVAPEPVTWALSLIDWKFKKTQTMKFTPPDTCLEDYEKRRGAFLKLIAFTPNVSVRSKEFRRWIDENSPYRDEENQNRRAAENLLQNGRP
jgi:hypothetical protein